MINNNIRDKTQKTEVVQQKHRPKLGVNSDARGGELFLLPMCHYGFSW